MPIFYQALLNEDDRQGFLPEQESQHCVKVLRLKVGDTFRVINGRGTLFEARLAKADAKKAEIDILSRHCEHGKRNYLLQLAIAPVKNTERLEWMVEKLTEIGIDRISFLHCRHSERKQLNLERLEKIVLSAAKQSQKAFLPELIELQPFDRFIRQDFEDTQCFVAHLVKEEDQRQLLAQSLKTQPSRYCMLIGPEGDFSEEEIALAKEKNFLPVSLGPERLRTETAGLTACHTLHILQSLWGAEK